MDEMFNPDNMIATNGETIVDSGNNGRSNSVDTTPDLPANTPRDNTVSSEAKEELQTDIKVNDHLNKILGLDEEVAADKKEIKVDEDGNELPSKEDSSVDTDKTVENSGKSKLKRDYSAFTPDEAKILKSAPNHVFDYVRALKESAKKLDDIPKLQQELTTLKAGKTQLPTSYYEHENAFTLDPSFKEVENYVGTTKAVVGHWQKQLAMVEANQPWQDLEDILDAKGEPTGQIRYGKSFPASPESKAMIINAIIAKQQELANGTNELNAKRNEFVNNKKQLFANIKAEEDKIFPHFKDKSDANVDKIMSFLDGHGLKNDLLAQPFSKALSTIFMLQQEITKLTTKTNNGKTVNLLTKQNPPTTKAGGKSVVSESGELQGAALDDVMNRLGALTGHHV